MLLLWQLRCFKAPLRDQPGYFGGSRQRSSLVALGYLCLLLESRIDSCCSPVVHELVERLQPCGRVLSALRATRRSARSGRLLFLLIRNQKTSSRAIVQVCLDSEHEYQSLPCPAEGKPGIKLNERPGFRSPSASSGLLSPRTFIQELEESWPSSSPDQ